MNAAFQPEIIVKPSYSMGRIFVRWMNHSLTMIVGILTFTTQVSAPVKIDYTVSAGLLIG
ncbi:hypothetical protein CP556_20230 [Natrinema sp. CBA1119]|nr:hypothetical protein CP556_20230 [Natrinema sp. CBA1119]